MMTTRDQLWQAQLTEAKGWIARNGDPDVQLVAAAIKREPGSSYTMFRMALIVTALGDEPCACSSGPTPCGDCALVESILEEVHQR